MTYWTDQCGKRYLRRYVE